MILTWLATVVAIAALVAAWVVAQRPCLDDPGPLSPGARNDRELLMREGRAG